MTTKSTTDSSSVSQGTTMSVSPSSSATIGAKANTMMTSFTHLHQRVGRVAARQLHTKTIAVQGAAPSRIIPAM